MGDETVLCPHCGSENVPGEDLCESCRHDLTHLNVPRGTTALQQHLLEDPVTVLPLRPPVLTPPHARLQDVLGPMRDQGVGAILIVDGRQPVGIFTERDYLYRVLLQKVDMRHTPVSQVMTPSPVTIQPAHSLAFALREMALGRYRHLPVLTDQQECLGILSADGILSYIVDHLDGEEGS